MFLNFTRIFLSLLLIRERSLYHIPTARTVPLNFQPDKNHLFLTDKVFVSQFIWNHQYLEAVFFQIAVELKSCISSFFQQSSIDAVFLLVFYRKLHQAITFIKTWMQFPTDNYRVTGSAPDLTL